MNKYNKSKIYKLINPDLPNIIYIGSTIQTLKRRFAKHKSECKTKNISSKILFSVGEPEIILLENYPCECKKDLLIKEQEYINNVGCINKYNSFGINEEKKKEYFKEYNNEYKKKNKEILKEKAKEKITCACGSIYTKYNKSHHEKSKKHINYIKE